MPCAGHRAGYAREDDVEGHEGEAPAAARHEPRRKALPARRPIAGVDPAARDFILQTILTNYSPESTVLISTHLIADIEPVLDEVIFLKEGRVVRHDSTDNIRGAEGKSVDEVFREVFRTIDGR